MVSGRPGASVRPGSTKFPTKQYKLEAEARRERVFQSGQSLGIGRLQPVLGVAATAGAEL